MDDKADRNTEKARPRIANLTLTSLDGKPILLKELEGKAGVAIGFLHGTYCPACLQQLTRANRYATALAEHGVTLVWLLQDKPTSISAYRLAAQPPPRYDLLPDGQPSLAEHFRESDAGGESAAQPTLIFLDTDSTLRYVERSDNPHAPLHIEKLLAVIETTSDPGAGQE